MDALVRVCGACMPEAAVWAPSPPHRTACVPPKLVRGLQSSCNEAQPRIIDVYQAWVARGDDMGVVVANQLELAAGRGAPTLHAATLHRCLAPSNA
jgi:hypothetical protein